MMRRQDRKKGARYGSSTISSIPSSLFRHPRSPGSPPSDRQGSRPVTQGMSSRKSPSGLRWNEGGSAALSPRSSDSHPDPRRHHTLVRRARDRDTVSVPHLAQPRAANPHHPAARNYSGAQLTHIDKAVSQHIARARTGDQNGRMSVFSRQP